MTELPDSLDLASCATALRNAGDAGEGAGTELEEGAARHRAVLQRMIAEHGRLVYRVAFAVARNAADAEDVVQETFLQLLRGSRDRLTDGVIGDEPGYLARIAWRLAVRRRKGPKAQDGAEELLRELPAAGGTPEEAAIQSDLESWLHRRVDELPEKLRQALVLSALRELTSPQIAGMLGVPEGTVRRRIHTARQILRRQLEAREGGSR